MTFRRGEPEATPEPEGKVAQFDGMCPECNDPIVADVDEITWNANREWIHQECG